MSFITEWLRQCSNCFNNSNEKSTSINSDYYINIENLSKDCFYHLKEKDFICEKCFLKFFLYDRFIIHQLFYYLKREKQRNYIYLKDLYIFVQRIINWNEFNNHLDFILQLFQIISTENLNQNSIYELIQDAFFFTTIQSNIQADENEVSLEINPFFLLILLFN